MKRLFAVLITISLTLTFLAGCGGKDRELYAKTKLSKYVELSDYMGIEIDTSTDEFTSLCDKIKDDDVYNGALYKPVYEGKVKEGDMVNIDYVGKKGGVAFEGGTASDAQLVIGSNSFIDGFEDGLIGVSVGETVDLNLTFPKDYSSEELAGQAVVFTVKLNYIYAYKVPEEYYSDLGFDTLNDYVKDVKKRASKDYILDFVVDAAKIKDYPADQQDILCEAIFDYYDDQYDKQYEPYGYDFETLLASSGYTEESYKAEIKSEIVPDMMQTQMVMYYIFDEEELSLTEEDVEAQQVEPDQIAESYAVQDIVLDYLYDNAKIK